MEDASVEELVAAAPKSIVDAMFTRRRRKGVEFDPTQRLLDARLCGDGGIQSGRELPDKKRRQQQWKLVCNKRPVGKGGL